MFGVVCLVAALALLGSAAEPRVFPVYVSGRAEALPLTLSPSESYEDAVNRFMIQNDLPESIFPQLVSEVQRLAAAVESTPVEQGPLLFTLMVDLDEVLVPLPVHEGDNSFALARAFCEAHGLLGGEDDASIIQGVEDAILAKASTVLNAPPPRLSEDDNAGPPRVKQPIGNLTVEVDDDKPVLLQLYLGESPDAAVRRFCAENGLTDPEVFASVMESLLPEVQKRLASIDLSMEITVKGQRRMFGYVASQDLDQAIDSFLSSNGLADVDNKGEIVARIADALLWRSKNAPVRAPLGRQLLVVQVEVVDRDALLPLIVYEFQNVLSAVDSFLVENDLPRSQAPVLSKTVRAKLAQEGISLKLFEFPIKIAGGVYQMDFTEGEDVNAVIKEFLASVGLADNEFVSEYESGVRTALEGFLQRVGVHPIPAAEAAGVEDEGFVSSSLVIGGTQYDLEYPRNASFPEIAHSFCRKEWDLLEPLLRTGLGLSVSTKDCGDVVSRYMGEQWSTTGMSPIP